MLDVCLSWSRSKHHRYEAVSQEHCGESSGLTETLTELIDRRPRAMAATTVLACTGCGSCVAKVMMDLTWVEAFYFSVTTISTVGYGDINPVTHGPRHRKQLHYASMAFHVIYIVIGVAAVGAAAALVLYSHQDTILSLRATVRRAAAAFVALALAGAAVMCQLEGWDAMHGLYWAVVTLSSVGYGHLVPRFDAGRVVASLIMLGGVGCQATLFTALALLPAALRRRRLERRAMEHLARGKDKGGLADEELLELTAGETMKAWRLSSSDSYVTRDEFCLAMLLRLEKISAEDLRLVQDTFLRLDANRSGKLESRERASRRESQRELTASLDF